MPTELAPNRQAEQSLEVMEVELPSDLPLAAVQSPAVATKIIDVQAKPARNVLNPNETEQEQE